MSTFCLVNTTFPDEQSAKKMIVLLLEQRLIACAQIIPVQSLYRWEGALCEENECLVVMKTRSDCFGAIQELFLKHHPYHIPQLIQIPIEQGLEAYLAWITDETTSKEKDDAFHS